MRHFLWNNRFLNAPVLAVTLLVSMCEILHADITIDSFLDAEGPLSAGPGVSAGTFADSYPHVLGGRTLLLTASAGGFITFPPSYTIQANITTINGFPCLEYTALDNQAAGELELTYGSDRDSYPGAPTPLGLTVNPSQDFLSLTFLAYNDPQEQDMTVNAFLNSETATGPMVSATLATPDLQVLDYPLTSLTTDTLDFVTFDFNAPPGADFQLASVMLMPEPAIFPAIILLCGSVSIRRAKRLSSKFNSNTPTAHRSPRNNLHLSATASR
ncbi:MAG TPA: hypothetical protein VGG19_19035 [Tepidisphaeraceae bacterium]|jgi:hypothetical protein